MRLSICLLVFGALILGGCAPNKPTHDSIFHAPLSPAIAHLKEQEKTVFAPTEEGPTITEFFQELFSLP